MAPHDRIGLSKDSAALLQTLVIALSAAALSMWCTGFVFGIDNNLFHLPIVAGLYDEPQFQDDAFIQSLHYFASGLWLVLSGTQKYFGRTDALFFVLAYLSRLLTFIGFLSCASLLGIVERRDKIVFSLLLGLTPFMYGYTSAGTGGLFINCFTHSEVANGTMLLAIYFAARKWFVGATLALCVTFFVNAFMAVWLTPLLSLIASWFLLKRETTFAFLSKSIFVGVVLGAPLIYPVLHSIFANPDLGTPLSIDYASYLREYFGRHSLVDTLPPGDVSVFCIVAVLGAVALLHLGPPARALQIAYLGAALLYFLGVVIPNFSTSPFLLNIQLLRSGTIIYLLAGLSVTVLATKWLHDDRSPWFLPGCLIVLALSLDQRAFIIAAIIILVDRVYPARSRSVQFYHRRIGYLILTGVAMVLCPLWISEFNQLDKLSSEAVEQWKNVGDWARSTTAANSVFLMPFSSDEELTSEHNSAGSMLSHSAIFEFASHRRVWVDYKRGAAAMWMPSYYGIWHKRVTDMSNLNSHAERLAYASANEINYVVDLCENLPSKADVEFRTTQLCVSKSQ